MDRPNPSPHDGPSESDLAYAHAVEVCTRIIRELDEQLKGSKYDGKNSNRPPDSRKPV